MFILAPCDEIKCGEHAFCKPEGQEAYCICEEGWNYNPKDISAGCIGRVNCGFLIYYYIVFITSVVILLGYLQMLMNVTNRMVHLEDVARMQFVKMHPVPSVVNVALDFLEIHFISA